MRKLRLVHMLVFGIMLLSVSIGSQAALKVIATTQDLAAIAKEVGGQHVQVQSLTRGTRDPHFAAAKPSMIRKVFHADLLLLVGADMEIAWLPVLLQSARNAKVLPGNNGYLDISLLIPLLGKLDGPVSRSMGDVHAGGNPHYWLDPRNGLLIAQGITNRLIAIDPENKKDYQKQFNKFKEKLNARWGIWQQELSWLKGKPVIAYHRSFIYLAKAFDFNIVAEVEPKPGISPSAASLTRLVSFIRNDAIGLLIMEPYYERRSAAYLNEKTDIHISVLPQSVGAQKNIKTYFDLFDEIVKAFNQSRVK